MPVILTNADKRKLVGVNPVLVAVVEEVARRYDRRFVVIEGLRSQERQLELLRRRKTKTLFSKHQVGWAVDIAPYEVLGKDPWPWESFTPLVQCAKAVAADIGTPMNFGYDWGWDAPHWELR